MGQLQQIQDRLWLPSLADVVTWLLRRLSPETAHDLAMALLSHRAHRFLPTPRLPRFEVGLGVTVPGIGRLNHPVGLGAGFDKQGRAPKAFAHLGLAFLEIGTVTPMPQPGNAKPRLFRYPAVRGLINRMGFNSDGAAVVADRLQALRWQHEPVPLGVNCGKNKDTPPERAIYDYLTVMNSMAALARYFVVNVSSPNTPGLRALATPQFLHGLADEIDPSLLARTWVKLDPDLSRREFQGLVTVLCERGFQGLIATNTHRVAWPETGGQSGHALMGPSTACLEWAWAVHQGRLPMIASGGILTGLDVYEKMIRGANAVQIYTALVYRGPWAVARILTELVAELTLRGYSDINDVIGTYYQ